MVSQNFQNVWGEGCVSCPATPGLPKQGTGVGDRYIIPKTIEDRNNDAKKPFDAVSNAGPYQPIVMPANGP